MSSPSRPERHRHRIGRYVVTGRIGKGGMGMVYRGLDEALDREVAVKTLTVEGTLDAESRRRFEVEARAAAKLQHPNIVTVFELGEERGMPFIAMELLPGADLETLLRSGDELLLAEKLEVVVEVSRGLAYAHEHGVVHRDIKPSNIRILDDGTAKIMDFGIAKLGNTTLTKTGMMVGTIHYMSPEQVRGKPLDGRSDVFSLGVILHELLAGQRPFRGEGPTDILYKIVHEPAEPLDVSALALDPRLAAVVAGALEKDADRRYPTATALAEALQVILDEERKRVSTAPPSEPLLTARRLLKEGHIEEGLTRLRALAEDTPTSIEVRRALRVAHRAAEGRARPTDEVSPDEFPELLATYRSPPTARPGEPEPNWPPPTQALEAPATRVLPSEQVPPPPRSLARVVAACAFLVAIGLALGVAYLRSSGRPAAVPAAGPTASPPPSGAASPLAPPAASEAPVSRPARPAAGVKVIVPVITDPPGATVSLDGEKMKGTTPLDVTVDSASAHRLVVSLEGYAAPETAFPAGKPPGEVRLRLEPAGPLATVTVASTYPLDVTWRGRVLARGEVSPRLSVPGGRQVLVVASSAHFLRAELVVNVAPGGEASIGAPALGRVSIRANPDNCQVFIDGTFVDYPPILDKAVSAGSHTVSFKWPDGKEARETVDVQGSKVAFVVGRKE